ncbi:MAG: putative zinc-binding metallopeptidase [Candidatus Omnitrophota bacterium]
MSKKKIDIANISEEELLSVRICDLPLDIDDSPLKDSVEKLYNDLAAKGTHFKPRCYLADEWLTPDGEPVIGIPFFLAHPALIRLEKKIMLEAEGETKEWCMKLLRHETGHAINYAYKLYKKKKWQKVFGPISREYGDTYKFRPYSRNYVRHLEDYYAQYHPDEDFAETFAVWLTPGSDWTNRYKNWKALGKLEYVDSLMEEIKEKPPAQKKGKLYWQASRLRTTLRNHYKKKKSFHAEVFPDFHDTNLKKIFAEKSASDARAGSAYTLITTYRKNIMMSVSAWTGEKKYVIDDLLTTLTKRSKELDLAVAEAEPLAILKISVYLTTLVMNYLHTGSLRAAK